MDLQIRDIRFHQFRNYQELYLDNLGPLTIFVGKNAIGKTNIIEGIQLVTALSTFRNAPSKQLPLWGCDDSYIEASLRNDSRDLRLKMTIESSRRKYLLNGKPKRIHDLREILPSVVFSPDDLELIKGSYSKKRSALDNLGSQLSSQYYVVKKDYDKVIQHKNKLLKEEYSSQYLESINETLITVGSQLVWYRLSLFEKLKPVIKSYYESITGNAEELEISYVPSWVDYDPEIPFKEQSYSKDDIKELLHTSLQQNAAEEKRRNSSLIGPHADKIEFYLESRNAKTYGSQGQQRSLVLAYKLTEVKLIEDILNQKPVLLLDDVMSELDSSRREALLEFISDEIQTFITTTHLQYFPEDILKKAQIIDLPLSKN